MKRVYIDYMFVLPPRRLDFESFILRSKECEVFLVVQW